MVVVSAWCSYVETSFHVVTILTNLANIAWCIMLYLQATLDPMLFFIYTPFKCFVGFIWWKHLLHQLHFAPTTLAFMVDFFNLTLLFIIANRYSSDADVSQREMRWLVLTFVFHIVSILLMFMYECCWKPYIRQHHPYLVHIYAYKVNVVESIQDDNETCSICLDTLGVILSANERDVGEQQQDDQQVVEQVHRDDVYALECRHKFHQRCISTWFQVQTTCPVCRDSVRI